MNTKRVVIICLGVAVVGFAYYAVSPLFRNVRVDEPLPTPLFEDASVQTTDHTTTDASSQDTVEEISSDRVAIVATTAHPGSGFVRIIRLGDKSFVRYEDLKTINGPDIYVYLSKDIDAKEYVEISRVRATEGNINYEIPAGINPREYPYVLIWCKAFGVLFNSAKVY